MCSPCGKDGCGYAGGQAAGAITRCIHQDSLSLSSTAVEYISQPGEHGAKFSPVDSKQVRHVPHPGLRISAMHVNALFLLLTCGVVCAGPALTTGVRVRTALGRDKTEGESRPRKGNGPMKRQNH